MRIVAIKDKLPEKCFFWTLHEKGQMSYIVTEETIPGSRPKLRRTDKVKADFKEGRIRAERGTQDREK